MVFVAISGASGTGKTCVAKILVKNLNKGVKLSVQKYKLIVLNELAERTKAYVGFDKARQSKIVSVRRLKAEVKKLSKRHENVVLEGHFAHLFDADIVIILRCEPAVLERRLRRKYKWPTKIRENVEAEMIGLITEEALPLHKPGTIFEIDTMERTAAQTAKIIERIVRNEDNERAKHIAGKIDWLTKV